MEEGNSFEEETRGRGVRANHRLDTAPFQRHPRKRPAVAMGKAAKGGKKLPSAPLADKKKKAKKNPLFEKAWEGGMAFTCTFVHIHAHFFARLWRGVGKRICLHRWDKHLKQILVQVLLFGVGMGRQVGIHRDVG